jgi:hypothetical protein
LISHPLGASIGRAEIEFAIFIDPARADQLIARHVPLLDLHEAQVAQAAIDLVSTRKNDGCLVSRFADGLENVERPACIDLKVIHRIGEAGRNSRLRREVKHRASICQCRIDSRPIADIGDSHLQPVAMTLLQPGQVLLHAATAEIIEHADRLAVTEQGIGEIGADKARTTGDHDGFAVRTQQRCFLHETRPRSSSCRFISAPRSTAWA